MKNYKSQSTEYPIAVDISNKKIIIVNSNPVEIPATEETPMMYEYDVTEYTINEYITQKQQENSNAIDELTIAILEG